MSIFGAIMSKIFGHHVAGAAQPGPAAAPAPAQAAPQAAPAAPQAAAPQVNVEDVLDDIGADSGQQLNWRTSIVDLMKLLGLDSNLDNRKQLAAELHYTGDTDDSATMNIWLHKEVMRQLEANGGKVPDDLKA